MTKKFDKKRLILVISGAALLIIGLIGLLVTFLTRDKKFPLDSDQFGSSEFIDISGEDYEKLLSEKKSFLVFVDQEGCITARGLEERLGQISREKNLKIYHIMFSDARNTSMHENVKHYPSVVIIDKGKMAAWLKADADEDKERYNSLEDLEQWLNNYIKWS